MFENALQIIKDSNFIVIHRHSSPDGDAIGSQTGLKMIIQANFPYKQVFAVGDGAGRYSFMENSEMDLVDDSFFPSALSIILDTSAPRLISDNRYQNSANTLRFDHHIFCEKIASTEIVDTSFESCCGLIAAFALESSLTVPPLAAKALFTGMVTDSGRFSYDCTTERTFALATFLLKQGFNLSDVYSNLYTEDFDIIKLKALHTLKIQFTKNKVAYVYTSLAELENLHVEPFTVSRGMVNTMSGIRGVSIWVNFTETKEGILCELRSSGFNINPIAVKYGGGGHQKASGACVPDYESAMKMLSDLDALSGEENE